MSEYNLMQIWNKICDDIDNGEHVDSDWIRDSFDLGGYDIISHEHHNKLITKDSEELRQLKTQKDMLLDVVRFYAEGNSHYDSNYEWGNRHNPESGTEINRSGERATQVLEKLGEQ